MPLLMTAICDCCNKTILFNIDSVSKSDVIYHVRKNKHWQYGTKGLFCEKCKHHYKLKTCKQLELKTKLKNQIELLEVFTQALTFTDFENETFHLDETDTTTWMSKDEVEINILKIKEKISQLKRKITND